MDPLLSVEAARERVLKEFTSLPAETVGLREALGRVLAGDLAARQDLPPFSNSSMDGYALRAGEIRGASARNPIRLRVVLEVPAGTSPAAPLPPGAAARVMTGAPIPAGADCVVPMEQTDLGSSPAALPSEIGILTAIPAGANVRPAGFDLRAGETVLSRGARLRPQEIALLASLGESSIAVTRRPRIAVVSTGSELVPVGRSLRPGEIFESNSWMLGGLVSELGAQPILLDIAPDDPAEVGLRFDTAVERGADLILSSAGVSVGEYDYVRPVVEKRGRLSFWRVNLRPGRPLAFGRYRGVPLLGLPGNPVSSFVTFELFARPAIAALLGSVPRPRPRVTARLDQDLDSDGRESYLRAQAQWDSGQWKVGLSGSQESSALSALSRANSLIRLPAGTTHVPGGSPVEVWLLED
ncbi:MAG: gephyrin-like molybdotransferase Glp [Anaerolineales bacterium]|jgi:molybdopterin molybdotransferase